MWVKEIHCKETYVLSQLLEEARCSLLPQLKRPRPRTVWGGWGPGGQQCSLFHPHIPATDGKVRWWQLTERTLKVHRSAFHLSRWKIDGTCLVCPVGEVYSTRYLSGRSSGGVQVARKDWWVASDVTKLVGASGGPPVRCIKSVHNSILAPMLMLQPFTQ